MAEKQDKVYDEFEIEFSLEGKSRKDLRDTTILKFLEEKEAIGKIILNMSQDSNILLKN